MSKILELLVPPQLISPKIAYFIVKNRIIKLLKVESDEK